MEIGRLQEAGAIHGCFAPLGPVFFAVARYPFEAKVGYSPLGPSLQYDAARQRRSGNGPFFIPCPFSPESGLHA